MQRVLVQLATMLSVIAVLATPPPASAQEEGSSDARQLAQQRFREAREAFEQERFAAAASLFEAADRLAPRAATRYNAATAWEVAGEAARAATGYEAVLGAPDLTRDMRKEAEARLAPLKKNLARVHISLPLGALVTVDHVQRSPVPTTFFLRPGPYDISVEYRGTRSTTPLVARAAATHEVELELPPETLPKPNAPPGVLPPDGPPSPPSAPDDSRKTWGWVGIGAGVAIGVVAAVMGVQALSARDRFRNSNYTDAEARQEAKDLRLATNVLWGGAGAAGAAGLVLLLTAPTVQF